MRFSLFILSFISLLPLTIKAQQGTFDELNHQFDEIICAEAKAHHYKQQQSVEALNLLTQNYDIVYHRANWKIDPAVNYINGNITSYFKPKATLNEIYFDLMNNMTVDSVKYHQQKCAFVQQNDNTIKIVLPNAVLSNNTDSLTVWYQGQPIGGGFGSFIQATHSGTPAIWTLSEPYGARDWWPCKQGLQDKIDSLDIIVTCPQGNKVGSNGVLINTTTNGNEVTYHWKHRYPIATYLVAISVTNYEEFTDYANLTNGKLPILNYVYPENLASAQTDTKAVIPIIEFYDSLFVPYPFYKEKYGHAQFGWGGGMEHQTMSFMVNFGYELIAHELGHQWFGDATTCGSWEDIWLNEGFATYLSGLVYERFSKNQYWPQFKKSRLNSILSTPDGSVWVNDTTQIDRIFNSRLSYAKGAYLLHMLRWELGDAIFFQAIRNYLNDPAHKYAFGQTKYLKAHFEKLSGRNLDEFFKDWFYGEGYPIYNIRWSQTADKQLNILVDQTTSSAKVDFFEINIPIVVRGTNGETLNLRLKNDFSGQIFTEPLNFVAKSINFDPENWLIAQSEIFLVHAKDIIINDGNILKACPNPVNDKLWITLDQYQPQSYRITDVNGKILAHQVVQNLQSIDVSNFPNGIYFLSVQTEKGILVTKFLKQ